MEVQRLQHARGGSRRDPGRSPSAGPSCRSCRAPTADGRSGRCANASDSSSPSSEEVVPAGRAPRRASRGPSSRYPRTTVRSSDGIACLERADDVEPVVVAAAVAVAVHGEEHSRLDLREPVDDARHAEVGRAARPDGADARARVERDDRLDDVRDVADDAVARPDPGRAKRRRRNARVRLAELSPGPSRTSGCEARTRDGSRWRSSSSVRGRRARRS